MGLLLLVLIKHKGPLTLSQGFSFKKLLGLLCKICQLLINLTYA